VGIFFYLLFAGSPVQGQMPMFFYFLAIYAGFFIAYSVVNVPYSALTPDMTKDFNERTSLTGYRMAAAIVGTLIAGRTSR
jgi:GPH family glycoside/pentoside/hexuronide:cation symporter